MSALLSVLPPALMRDIGWTLIHFLWQGAGLAVLLHLALPVCRGAVARHNCVLAILILMAWSPVATFLLLHDFGSVGAGAPIALAPTLSAGWINGLVLLWLAGVVLLSLRALVGWHLVRRLEHHGTMALPADLMQRCRNLQRRLAVGGPVRFLLSHRICVPLVIGALRPLVLIPVSALTSLPPQQLDALILHELAHIRRLDTITNLLLVAVETVLFYHPAVWWVGRRLRIEREHACDDFAVSACGDAALYVEALTSLESWRANGMALAANGGQLKQRAARLLQAPAQGQKASLPAVAGLALLGLLAASVATAQSAYPSRDKISVMLRPIMETHQLPPYPSESVHLREEGRVLVEVTIATDGTVSRAVVVGPSGHARLDTAAANFVKGYWRWQPAVRSGKTVTANTRVSVLFKLKPAKKSA